MVHFIVLLSLCKIDEHKIFIKLAKEMLEKVTKQIDL
jgi:hypothetical protein